MELSALLLFDSNGSVSSLATNLQRRRKKKWGAEKISILNCVEIQQGEGTLFLLITCLESIHISPNNDLEASSL